MKKLTLWKNKKNDLSTMMRSFNNMLEELWRNPFEPIFEDWNLDNKFLTPAVNVVDNGKEIKVKAELPGMEEKDIEVSYQNGMLNIRGEKKEEKEESKGKRYYKECSYGYVNRSIPVGENVDFENAKAKYKNGVLTITLPKTKDNEKKSIEIKVE